MGQYVTPDEATLRRTLRSVDPDEVDRLVAAFLAARRPSPAADDDSLRAVALDGKTVRVPGCTPTRTAAPHTWSAWSGIATRSCSVRSRSTRSPTRSPPSQPLLKDLDLARTVVTADALCRYRHRASYA